MRARTAAALIGCVLAAMSAAGCSSHKTRSRSTTSTTSPTAIVRVQPPRDADLARVLTAWTRHNKAAGAVVGVRVGTRGPVFVVAGRALRRTPITATTPFRVAGLPGAFTDANAATAQNLLTFSDTYFRAHLHAERDLSKSFFKIGRSGKGNGVMGVSSDGFCALAPKGCPRGAQFFAVGATGSFPGGAAVILYDPVYDLSVVSLAKAGRADVGNLALRADLLSKLGAAGYEKAVGFSARPVPTTRGH